AICPQDALGNCPTKNPRLNDEFGGFTVGGPIVKNKAFLFGGFDQEILSGNNILTTTNLTPTPAGLAALAACFPSGIQNDAVSAVTKFGPFGVKGGNPQVVVPPGGLVNPVTACPAATFGGVSRTVSQPGHQFDLISKVDLNLGANTITTRY